MRPFSTFGQTRPALAASVVLAIFAMWFALPLLLSGPVDVTGGSGVISLDALQPLVRSEALAAVILLCCVALLRWGTATGLRGRADPAGLRLAAWFIVPATLIVSGIWSSLLISGDPARLLPDMALILTFAGLVGLFEELLFRGVVMHGLRARLGTGAAVVWSSLVFGVFHMANALVGQDLTLTVIQMASSTGLGLFFAVLTLQARSLWPAIVLHALWDAFALTAPLSLHLLPEADRIAPTPGWQALVIPAVLSVLSLVLYRRWQQRQRVIA